MARKKPTAEPVTPPAQGVAQMPQAVIGSTGFEWDDEFRRVKVTTAEGSVVAVPGEDLLKFVYGAFVLPSRRVRDDRKDWKDGLLG